MQHRSRGTYLLTTSFRRKCLCLAELGWVAPGLSLVLTVALTPVLCKQGQPTSLSVPELSSLTEMTLPRPDVLGQFTLLDLQYRQVVHQLSLQLKYHAVFPKVSAWTRCGKHHWHWALQHRIWRKVSKRHLLQHTVQRRPSFCSKPMTHRISLLAATSAHRSGRCLSFTRTLCWLHWPHLWQLQWPCRQ